MFAFPYVDSVSHYESTNRVEERRASVFLLDVLHCGLSTEAQMLLLLQQMIACSIRGYTVVGPVHLDVRFSNGAGISVRKEHTLMAEHAMQSLDLGCVAWRTLTSGVIFLRVLFRHWVHINPNLRVELSLAHWENAQTGRHAFWTFLKNSMTEQFGRLGLARELMCPLSFGAPGPKFSFVDVGEAQRYAALHDRHRQSVAANLTARPLSPQPSTSNTSARAPLAPTFCPIAPMRPTVPTPANIPAPEARTVVPMRASHPVLTSLLQRPPVAPADLPPPPPQRTSIPNNTFTFNDVVVDVQALVRAAEAVGHQMAQAPAHSSAARILTPPPPPHAPRAQIAGNGQAQPAQNRQYTREEGAVIARELEDLLESLEREGFGPTTTAARDRPQSAQQESSAARGFGPTTTAARDRPPSAQQGSSAARACGPPPPQQQAAIAGLNGQIKTEPADDGALPAPPPQRQATPSAELVNAKQEPPEHAAVVPEAANTRSRSPDPGYSQAVRWLKRKLYSLEQEAPEEEDESPTPKSRKQ